ncbi:T9SS type A sorting domain-containing protein [Fulvivirga ligni]|uniref:T9SS type A sorting domain-containing protein n=1 Tax=Fulvivirga ligni TaxID=2904246 RepID=UPI001F406D2A|nr:T9SS type A sorting domain-containing protein [Fulvivirga ligni]UII21538.1 T9SS type A sorting domain-containing protein [Fulvivirga ligni]
MKQTILFFTLIISVFSASGQVSENNPFLIQPPRPNPMQLAAGKQAEANITAEQTELHQLDSLIMYGFDQPSGKWAIPLARQRFEYTEDHQILSMELWNWDDNKKEEYPVNRTEYEYYEDGKLSDIIYSVPGSEAGEWIAAQQEGYSYQEDGNIKESMRMAYDFSTGWMLADRTYYYYENGHLGSTVMHIPGTEPGTLVPFVAYQYDYKGEYLDMVRVFRYEGETTIAILSKSYEYDYFHKLYMVREHIFDEISNDWLPYQVKGYSYDDDDYFDSYSFVQYSEGKVYEMFRSRYHFDKEVSGDQLIIPDFDDSEIRAFHHLVLDKDVYKLDMNSNEEIKNSEVQYYYTNLTTGEPTDPVEPKPVVGISDLADSIEVFPNPTTDYLHFNFPSAQEASLRLFDSQGNQVLMQKIENEKVDLTQLCPGIYFYHVYCGNEDLQGKLIKQ